MKNFFFIACLVLAFAGCSKNDGTSNNASAGASNNLGVGASAHDFLSGSLYNTVTIQIEYAPGMKLQQQSIDNLVAFLKTHLNKTGGIVVTQTQVSSVNKAQVSLQDVSDYEQRNRTVFTTGANIGVYILAADADYTTAGVGGIAYRNTSIVMLEKTIQARSGGLGQASTVKIETGILEHEFGHLLGLVNTGTAMVVPHLDEAHKPHCTNKNCLMYWQIETNGLVNEVNGGVPLLDDNCINDLRANGGK